MNPEELREIWARFLVGGELAGPEREALLEALRRDPGFRDEVVEDVDLHGLLRHLGRAGEGEETFAQSIAKYLSMECDATRFIESVRARVGQERQAKAGASLPGEAPAAVGRAAGGPRPRIRRWMARTGSGIGGYSWRFGLAAAAAFVMVVAFLAVSIPGRRPVPEGGMARPRAAEEEGRREAAARGEAAREAIRRMEGEARQARAERERLERELAAAEEERRRLDEARKLAEDEAKREELKAREAELAKAAEAFREKIREAQEKERQAAAKAAERPPERVQEKPLTQPAIARVERAEGAYLAAGGTKTALKGGKEILVDQAVEVEANGVAILAYPDGTRLQVGSDTEVLDLRAEGGKRVRVEKGVVHAEVARQPKDEPMVLRTPHGEATVLGTILRLVVGQQWTRLEVYEGKVRLTRAGDRKSVDVIAGHYAVAAAGVDLAARPLSGEVLFAEDFNRMPAGAWPAGWGRHPTDAATRSGFEVMEEPGRSGERFLGHPGTRTSTQHTYIPIVSWERDFVLSFRMRLSGPRNGRAGVEFEDGRPEDPAFVYDHAAGMFMVARSAAKVYLRVPLRLSERIWHDWRIVARGARSFSIAVGGRSLGTVEIPDFGPLTAASLNSGGADTAHFDDVRVTRH